LRVLLDTHVVLWELSGTRTVSGPAREAITAATDVFVSVVSFLEIGIKASIGTLDVPDELVSTLIAAGIEILPLDPEHGIAVAALPLHHRDPFDRLLVVQANAEGLTLVSADPEIGLYDVPLVVA
jgi:PIN domain nuclease of toxin-antitoxin system